MHNFSERKMQGYPYQQVLGNILMAENLHLFCIVICRGMGIPTGFGRVLYAGLGTGTDSHTCDISNEP